MITNNRVGTEIAKIVLKDGKNTKLSKLASRIIKDNRKENRRMRKILRKMCHD